MLSQKTIFIYIIASIFARTDFERMNALRNSVQGTEVLIQTNISNNHIAGFKDYESLLIKCFETFGDLWKMPFVQRNNIFEADLRDNKSFLFALKLEIQVLFKIYKIFTRIEDKVADLIINSYQIVSYHNICHGLAVGLYSAEIHAFKYDLYETKETVLALNKLSGAINAKYIPEDDYNKMIFFAGLLHDIGHPGFTNPSLFTLENEEYGKQFFNFFTWDTTNKNCKMIDEHFSTTLSGRSKTFPLKHFFLQNSIDKMAPLSAEGANFNDQVFEKGFKESLTYSNALIKKNYTPRAQSNDIPDPEKDLFEKFCNSAEIVHAVIALMILNLTKETFGVSDNSIVKDFIGSSILHTNMRLWAFKIQTKMSSDDMKNKANEKANFLIVHVADIIGCAAFSQDLRNELSKQLYFEFALENLKTGNTDFQGFKGKKDIEIDQSKWLEGQSKFLKTVQDELNKYQLTETAYFTFKEDKKINFNDGIEVLLGKFAIKTAKLEDPEKTVDSLFENVKEGISFVELKLKEVPIYSEKQNKILETMIFLI